MTNYLLVVLIDRRAIMNALKLKPEMDAPMYVEQTIHAPIVDALAMLEPAAPADLEQRRGLRRRIDALRRTGASSDEFHLFRIY
jgi:hypothetical protein